MSGKEYKARQRALAAAQDHFTRAAAALTGAWDGDPEAFALVEGALGLFELAKADTDEKALAVVEAYLSEQVAP